MAKIFVYIVLSTTGSGYEKEREHEGNEIGATVGWRERVFFDEEVKRRKGENKICVSQTNRVPRQTPQTRPVAYNIRFTLNIVLTFPTHSFPKHNQLPSTL